MTTVTDISHNGLKDNIDFMKQMLIIELKLKVVKTSFVQM
jgi:hypothetical protein